MERELFAANGYLVLAVNYRGSSGRGQAWKKAIYADWGNEEVQDVLAGVDHVIAMGIVDTTRMGIGGWSYGGILTDYTIATTTCFKVATSGVGSALRTKVGNAFAASGNEMTRPAGRRYGSGSPVRISCPYELTSPRAAPN